jgi:hypothetical protein
MPSICSFNQTVELKSIDTSFLKRVHVGIQRFKNLLVSHSPHDRSGPETWPYYTQNQDSKNGRQTRFMEVGRKHNKGTPPEHLRSKVHQSLCAPTCCVLYHVHRMTCEIYRNVLAIQTRSWYLEHLAKRENHTGR